MKLPLITLNHEKLSNFEASIQKEWLITNGLGGYSSSTILGINTRKYHGLLISAFNPPLNRWVCLEKLDEELIIKNNVYPLGANEFEGEIFPKGYVFLKEFSLSPFPRYIYNVENVEVRKLILMPHGKNAVIILYRILNKNGFDVKIKISPLINWRHFHSVTDRWKTPFKFVREQKTREVSLHPEEPKSTLMMIATKGQFFAENEGWIEKIYYREEAARGESCIDNYYKLGHFEVSVKAEEAEKFAISIVADENFEKTRKVLAEMPKKMSEAERMYENEILRREKTLKKFYGMHKGMREAEWLNFAVLSAENFLVKRINGKGKSIIAGYHWFGDWGRDTFISLPGLTLITGNFEDARNIFLTFKENCKDGLIPNFFSRSPNENQYNSVDATLWYINAVLQYLKYTNDFRFVYEKLWENLKLIIEKHVKGTIFNIHLDGDYLLSHGSQLTWMDTIVDGKPVTPRNGKAVEIQALWYNALKIMELLAEKFKEKSEAEKYYGIAEKTRESFVKKFWNTEKEYLFDVINEKFEDSSLRPNQIIAVALDFTMLDRSKSEKIVDIVQRELLTPYGLRTLESKDPRYKGVYMGDRRSRDLAYHNGAVWPWLLGFFIKGFLKTKGYTSLNREYAKNLLKPLFTKQFFEAGLGNISEIFDGDFPHNPKGCIAQAWSIAEPFRAYVEDVMQFRPKYEREILGIE